MKTKHVVTLTLGFIICGSTQAAGSLLTNGGFEKPVVTGETFVNEPTGASFGGWSVVGQPGGVQLSTAYVNKYGDDQSPHSGAQFVYFGYSDGTGVGAGVSQIVNLTVGSSYTLKFWVGNTYDIANLHRASSTVNVLLNGVTSMAATNYLNGESAIAWKQYSLTFTASAAKTEIAFINSTLGASPDWTALDDVSLALSN